MKIDTHGDQPVIEVKIRLHQVDANAVRVELYAGSRDGRETLRQEMTRLRNVLGGPGRVDRSTVSASRPASDFTPRLEGFRCGWRLSRSLAAVNLQ
jgi:starch phosphorylase